MNFTNASSIVFNEELVLNPEYNTPLKLVDKEKKLVRISKLTKAGRINKNFLRVELEESFIYTCTGATFDWQIANVAIEKDRGVVRGFSATIKHPDGFSFKVQGEKFFTEVFPFISISKGGHILTPLSLINGSIVVGDSVE